MPTTMMPTLHDIECPPEGELQGLMAGELVGDRSYEITDHLGGCALCRERMEFLATGETPVLPEALLHIETELPPKNSALWKAIDEAVVSVTRTGTAPKLDTDLKFLQPSPTPGRIGRIGEFDVIRLIGRGGMGVVLHAFDPDLHRDVAVKVLDPQLASNDTARQRFIREARAAAAVAHDNIVPVYTVSEDAFSGLPFFVMQLVNGESLEQRLRRAGKLSVGETARIGMQAAAGLAAAHATGLIHRDIKPGNILIEAGTERVKLTDFGLARANEDLKLTKTGFVSGTPLYMAPEQAKGDDVDARADLFSLGVVLYEALAGKPPFEGKTPLAVLRRVADDEHVPVSKLNPSVPEWFEDIIDRLLEKDPKRRIATAAQLQAELAALIPLSGSTKCDTGKTEPCPLVPPTSLSRRRKRRWQLRISAMLAIPFLIGVLVGGAFVASLALGRSKPEATSIKTPEVALSTPLYSISGGSGSALSIAVCPDGNTIVLGYEDGTTLVYSLAEQRIVKELEKHGGAVWGIEFFPDRRRFVSVSDDGRVKIWNLDNIIDGKPRYALPSANGVKAVAVDRSGQFIATGDRSGSIIVWDVDGQKGIHTFMHGSTISAIEFSTDPKQPMLATAGTDKTLKLWDLGVTAGSPRLTLDRHNGPIYSVSFSPNNERIASGSWDGTVKVWDTSNGKEVGHFVGHESAVSSVEYSPCGKFIATGGADGTVRIWESDTGRELRKYKAHKAMVHMVRFSHDCKTVFSGGRDGEVRAWETGKL